MQVKMLVFFFSLDDQRVLSSEQGQFFTVKYVHNSIEIINTFNIKYSNSKPMLTNPGTPYKMVSSMYSYQGQKENASLEATRTGFDTRVSSRVTKNHTISSKEHIVYVNNTAFIAAKERNSVGQGPKKVVGLLNRSKSRSIQKSKSKNSDQTNMTTPLKKSDQRRESLSKQLLDKQIRRIQILERRISQLHLGKQAVEIRLSHENSNLLRALQIRDQKIAYLEKELAQIIIRYQEKEREANQLSLRLQRVQKEKLASIDKEELNKESITTKNLINITLSQQIEHIKEQNMKLESQIQSLRQNHQQFEGKLPLQESHQLLQIDSEQFQVDQIITRITQITKQNQGLAKQLEQCKNQLSVKDAIGNETSRILSQIKDAISDGQKGQALEKIKLILDYAY